MGMFALESKTNSTARLKYHPLSLQTSSILQRSTWGKKSRMPSLPYPPILTTASGSPRKMRARSQGSMFCGSLMNRRLHPLPMVWIRKRMRRSLYLIWAAAHLIYPYLRLEKAFLRSRRPMAIPILGGKILICG